MHSESLERRERERERERERVMDCTILPVDYNSKLVQAQDRFQFST